MWKLEEILKATDGSLIQGAPTLKLKGISIDSRTIKAGELFIAIEGSRFNGHDFIQPAIDKGAAAILVEVKDSLPPIKVATVLVKDTIKALGDIGHYHRQHFNIPVIAVTGSNGKTTTKDMIAGVLATKFRVLKNEGTKNNQIGVPLTLLGLNPCHHFAVLELGTNHPGEIKRLMSICQSDIGVITNIGQTHLEFFRTSQGVFQEKSQLLKNIKDDGLCLINVDDKLLNKLSKDKKVITFGIKEECDFRAKGIFQYAQKIRFTVNGHKMILNSLGIYNVYNALAAIACARLFGLDYNPIGRVLSSFRFPPMHMQIDRINGAIIINDAYNANPTSLGVALEVLDNFKTKGKKILVMGDMLELGDKAKSLHRKIGKKIGLSNINILITTGTLTRFTCDAAHRFGMDKNAVYYCKDALEAAKILNQTLAPDDVVLVKGSRLCQMENVIQHLLGD